METKSLIETKNGAVVVISHKKAYELGFNKDSKTSEVIDWVKKAIQEKHEREVSK